MKYNGMTDEITMDYMDVVCNGKSSNSTSKINVLKKGLLPKQSIILLESIEPINN